VFGAAAVGAWGVGAGGAVFAVGRVAGGGGCDAGDDGAGAACGAGGVAVGGCGVGVIAPRGGDVCCCVCGCAPCCGVGVGAGAGSGPAITYAETCGNVVTGCGPPGHHAVPCGKGAGVPGPVGNRPVGCGVCGASAVGFCFGCCSGCPSSATRRTVTCAGDARTTSMVSSLPCGNGVGKRNGTSPFGVASNASLGSALGVMTTVPVMVAPGARFAISGEGRGIVAVFAAAAASI